MPSVSTETSSDLGVASLPKRPHSSSSSYSLLSTTPSSTPLAKKEEGNTTTTTVSTETMSACSSEETSSTTSAQSQHEPPHEKRARQDCSELEPQRKRKCVAKVTGCCVPLSAASEAGQSGVEASNEAVAAARPPAGSRRNHRPRDEERREDGNYRVDNLQREREEMWLNLYESRPQNNTSEMATWLITAMAVSDPKNIEQLHVLRGVDGIEQFVTRTSNMSDRSGSEQNDDTD